ncbi:MAG: hypothetical protein ICV72_07130, partial [Aldersonia sp.]|nr:hypothetical protein [Aldersonia sp.]
MPNAEPAIATHTWVSYEQFGENFFALAVTVPRIQSAVAGLAGRGLKFGPFGVGPAGLAGVVAEGSIGRPLIVQLNGSRVAYVLRVPASLVVRLALGGRRTSIAVGVEIDVQLRAKAAEPLCVVIDIPAVSPDDVRPIVRAGSNTWASAGLLEPIVGVIRREVAARINALLSDPDVVQRRVFDVAARIDERPDRPPSPPFSWLTYAEFGRRFFAHAVTQARVEAEVAGFGGQVLDLGPIRTGPGERVVVSARGEVATPRLTPRRGELISFGLVIPVRLDLVVAVARDNHYRADIEIPLTLTARAAEPLLIVIDAHAPRPEALAVTLSAVGLRAGLLGVIGRIEKQIRERVVAVVEDHLRDPSSRIVDVEARIDDRGVSRSA